jgi:hypothetical protein
MKTTNDVLKAAEAHLTKKGWCQHSMKDRKGRCCLIGSINEVTKHLPGGHKLFDTAVVKVGQAIPYHTPIVAFNDTKGRKIADIVAVLRKARGE